MELKLLQQVYLTMGSSTVVKNSPRHARVHGLSLDAAITGEKGKQK
jgi:hypothetical protein